MGALNSTHALRAFALVVAISFASLGGCDAWISVDTRLERAREHMEKGAFRSAVPELKSALQKEPENVAARVALAELSFWLGDVDAAAKEIDRALSAGAAEAQLSTLRYEVLFAQQRFDAVKDLLTKDASTPPVRRMVVQAQLESGQSDHVAAEKTLRSALQQAPEDGFALLELARLKAITADNAAAIEISRRVAGSPNLVGRASLLRGQALMLSGDYPQARDTLAQALADKRALRAPEQLAAAAALTEVNLALNDATAAEASLAAVASWAPQALVTHYLRARIAMLRNDAPTAAAEAQRALKVDPKHVQAQLLLAAAHLAQGAGEQAEDVLMRLLSSTPENAAARKLLAQVYLGRNEPERAQQVLAAAGDLQNDPEMNWLMGAALLETGVNAAGLDHLERSLAAQPEDAQRRLSLASAYIAAGSPDKSIELLNALPAASPLASQARRLLVLATASGKPRAQARREIQGLVARNGDDANVLSAAGAYFASIGDPKAARETLVRAIEIDPKAIDARMTLARVETAAFDGEAAERLLHEVIRIDTRHQPARLTLAELAWNAGDRAQARKWLEEAIAADPAATDARLRLAQLAFLEADQARGRGLLEQALSVARDRNRVLTAAGGVLAGASFTDDAFAKFREASAAGYAPATLAAAKLHLDLGQRPQARELIEAALAKNPKWLEADRLLVMIEVQDGEVDKAIARARSMLGETSPGAVRAAEGDVYALASRPADAIAAYEDAQRLEPSAANALKIFQVRRSAGEKQAERSLVHWLARSPDDADVRAVLAAYYESRGDTARAIPEYERLLAADRINPLLLNNLAWALHGRNDPRALSLAQRAYVAVPHVPAVADTYGWILVQMGKVDSGLDVLEKALVAAPTNPDIQYHAAVAYVKSDQTPRARELLQGALKFTGQFASRAEAEQLARALSTE